MKANPISEVLEEAPQSGSQEAESRGTFLPIQGVARLLSDQSTPSRVASKDVEPAIGTAKREVLTGIVLMLAILAVCGIVLLIGSSPDLFRPTYTLTAEFSDASGLTEGDDVNLSGALIGKVVSDPHLIPGTEKVRVELRIDQNIRLRQDAQYVIKSPGILGDRFVDVRPGTYRPGQPRSPYVHDGEVVQGVEAPDVRTLISATLPLIHRANHITAQVDHIVSRLNTGVLTDNTLGNLKYISTKLKEVADGSAKLVQNTHGLIAGIKSGHGALGELLYDKQVKSNLAAFMANLKAHGPIFYSDDSAAPPINIRSRPPWRARP